MPGSSGKRRAMLKMAGASRRNGSQVANPEKTISPSGSSTPRIRYCSASCGIVTKTEHDQHGAEQEPAAAFDGVGVRAVRHAQGVHHRGSQVAEAWSIHLVQRGDVGR